jgi:hypothetical protein
MNSTKYCKKAVRASKLTADTMECSPEDVIELSASNASDNCE